MFLNTEKQILDTKSLLSPDPVSITFTRNFRADYENLVAFVEENPKLINKTIGGCRKTLLHRCVEHNRLDMVEFLLERGAHHLYDINGNRPLHSVCLGGNREVAEILIKHGADKEIANIEGDAPIHLAAASENAEVLKCLLDNGTEIMRKGWARNYALHVAAENPNIDVIKELLKRGFDISVKNDNLETALHVAAGATGFDSVEHIQLLLEYGAKLDSR